MKGSGEAWIAGKAKEAAKEAGRQFETSSTNLGANRLVAAALQLKMNKYQKMDALWDRPAEALDRAIVAALHRKAIKTVISTAFDNALVHALKEAQPVITPFDAGVEVDEWAQRLEGLLCANGKWPRSAFLQLGDTHASFYGSQSKALQSVAAALAMAHVLLVDVTPADHGILDMLFNLPQAQLVWVSSTAAPKEHDTASKWLRKNQSLRHRRLMTDDIVAFFNSLK